MSSHPQDPQLPVDIRPITNLSSDDPDFWDLDSHTSDPGMDFQEKDDLENKSGAEKLDSETKAKKSDKSAIEKVTSIICYLTIIALFGYLAYYASKQHNFNTAKGYETNVPVSGEYASIQSIETWWKKPTGNQAQYGVTLIPVAKITLSDSSTSGKIRGIFFTSANPIISKEASRSGDSANLEFKNGKFTKSGSNEITIYGTDGFRESAHFIHYRSQIDERWTIQLSESAPNQHSNDQFKYLAKAPIEPLSK